MKEAFISPDTQVEIREVPIPVPKAGTNPKDWKVPIFLQKSVNSGDDVAGIIEAVGAGVSEFKPGDRVAGMHEIGTAHGSFAEFAITPASTTFHIPDNVTFEEAVTIPLNGLVAAYGLYHVLRLPAPWSPTGIKKTPFVIHGAGTAIGALAIKLVKAANIHPIIATAGNSSDFVNSLLDTEKGDALVDYQQPHDKFVAEIHSAIVKAGGGPAWYGLDCATNHDGAPEYKGVLDGALGLQAGLEDSAGRKPLVATVQAGSKFTGHVDGGDINVMVAHTGSNEEKCLAYTASRLFAYGLASGWLTGHPTEVVEGGLEGVGEALRRLKSEQVFGKKLIIKIGEL
ncbi:PKS-ER domain-containing protein [Fusarium keratoplasticum]|uniref:PKS-ER domain-containing protein n=1 Tax=Fusarium keratoplasticum TaxID=1328300 RepID=A0ACC0QG65_9HYPO|nr:PKS-ER domain-containing protein [Fusarium keratoplasticum]KAI8654499.1 PKS-ER domain-containing protein [Fusarium keratoplasticum]